MPDKKSHSDQLPLELSAIFSYSQLNTFKSCPQQFKIVYLDGIRKGYDSIEAFMGKRVHGVLEWLYNEDNRKKPYLTFDRLCKAYDEIWIDNWHNNIFIADPRRTTDYYYTIGKRCLSNYYGRYGPTFDEPVEEVEYELEFSIGNNAFRGMSEK